MYSRVQAFILSAALTCAVTSVAFKLPRDKYGSR